MKEGDKVVCLKGNWEKEPGEITPKKNEIYTIIHVEPDEEAGDFFVLKECSHEVAYWHKWFRPLDYDFVDKVLREISPQTVEA